MKTYSLSCKDMGIMCDYVAKAKTKEEAVKMGNEHFMKEHPVEAKEWGEKYSKKEMEKMAMDKVMEEMM